METYTFLYLFIIIFLQSLKDRLKEIIPLKQEEVKQVKSLYGNRSLGETTVDMVRRESRGKKKNLMSLCFFSG